MEPEARVERLQVTTCRVPTEDPESDGTAQWDHTDVIIAEASGGGQSGLGWTYGPRAVAALIEDQIRPVIERSPLADIEGAWQRMSRALRNAGRVGAGAMAMSAVDVALWDLKARVMGCSLIRLLGEVRSAVELYGSGGFTSYPPARLAAQMGGWAAEGFRHVKMKIGLGADEDRDRVRQARAAIGDAAELFVDANGAYDGKVALGLAWTFAQESGVRWFEEPVSSEDLAGLRRLSEEGPPGLEIAAGEYGDSPDYFRRMLEARAVDCLQADVTRCGGFTGFLKAAALCEAFHLPLSAHCAPQLHAHVGCACASLRHVEYFHDHARLEPLLFDGCLRPVEGRLAPDPSRPGHGLILNQRARERFAS